MNALTAAKFATTTNSAWSALLVGGIIGLLEMATGVGAVGSGMRQTPPSGALARERRIPKMMPKFPCGC